LSYPRLWAACRTCTRVSRWGSEIIGGFPERQVQDPQNVTDAAIALVVLGLQTRERAVFDQIPDVFDTDILCARGNDLHQRRHASFGSCGISIVASRRLSRFFVLSELLPVLLDGDHEVKLQREQRLQSGAERRRARLSSSPGTGEPAHLSASSMIRTGVGRSGALKTRAISSSPSRLWEGFRLLSVDCRQGWPRSSSTFPSRKGRARPLAPALCPAVPSQAPPRDACPQQLVEVHMVVCQLVEGLHRLECTRRRKALQLSGAHDPVPRTMLYISPSRPAAAVGVALQQLASSKLPEDLHRTVSSPAHASQQLLVRRAHRMTQRLDLAQQHRGSPPSSDARASRLA